MKQQPIGVMDSGVGGLTVLRELRKIMPSEQYLYYGDNGHCPFGNRTEQDLLGIIHHIMEYFKARNVKAAVLACNTSSALLDKFARQYPFPIFSIITPVANWVVHEKLDRVGVIATAVTIRSKAHERLIHAMDPHIEVVGQESLHLAGLVDHPFTSEELIVREVSCLVSSLREKAPVKDVILGCTHYPIVKAVFEAEAPEMRFIDPASSQAWAVKSYLRQHGQQEETGKGGLHIFTTGTSDTYAVMLKRLGISAADTIETSYDEKAMLIL